MVYERKSMRYTDRKKAFISSFLILFSLIIFAGILTRVIPTGAFERKNISGTVTINWKSFKYTSEEKLPIWRWFTAPIETLWSKEAPK